MKVLVLMGSPRKKDGHKVCQLIENKIVEKAKVEFEYVYLKNLAIEDCRGCDLCFQKGEDYCPIKDDLKLLKQKLLEADGIIFASPVYAYHVTGSLKRTIDRLSYLFHRPELVGKPALTVVTTGGGGQKEVTKYLKMTACGWGCNVIEHIEVISSMFFEGNSDHSYFNQKYHDKASKLIEASALAFHEAMINRKLPVPGFYELYMFNGLKSKTYTSQADYRFWEEKGWLNSQYYYDVKLGPAKRLFGYALNQMIKAIWKKMQSA